MGGERMSLLRRRSMLAALPGRRLQYLESDGDSYIDTGILPGDDLKIEVTFCHASAESVTSAPRQYVFGTYSKSGSSVVSRMQFIHGGDGSTTSMANRTRGMCGWGQGSAGTGWSAFDYGESQLTAESLTATADKDGFILDGAKIFTPVSHSFVNPLPIYLFACNAYGSETVYKSKGIRITGAYFERGGVAVGKFVPWEIGSRVGMLDLVNGIFHDNGGDGSFLKG